MLVVKVLQGCCKGVVKLFLSLSFLLSARPS
jgi:hypothetical protein